MGKRGPKATLSEEEKLVRTRAAVNKFNRKTANEGRDINPPHEDIDWLRRESCKLDLKLYLETYHEKDFTLSWSPDHIVLISTIQEAILSFLQQLIAYPRGSGKTSVFRRIGRSRSP